MKSAGECVGVIFSISFCWCTIGSDVVCHWGGLVLSQNCLFRLLSLRVPVVLCTLRSGAGCMSGEDHTGKLVGGFS